MASQPILDSFEVLERLGAGGMGEVFKARDRRLNRFVAIKFLPEGASADARERFQREALAVASLNHPHICTLHETGEAEGRPFLVLELLEGETLKARLARGAALEPDQLLDWSVQISDALDAAHRKGVLHRDLKPENIWIGAGGHIKVLDFGLARLEGESRSNEATLLTSPGVAMGTVPYMSPEQARGETLDARSDLFSFGSVFYEMASGRLAFPAKNAADSIAAVLHGQPMRLSQVRPELPPRIEEVANRCLEKDPDLRFQSAADLRSELKRVKRESGSATVAAGSASTGAITAAVPNAGSGARRRMPRNVIAAAAVIVAGTLAVLWWVRRPRPFVAPNLQFRQLTFSGNLVDAVISPDGKFLAHVNAGPSGTSLHLLSISSGSDVQITAPVPGCCQSPSFSPDGGQVYYLVGTSLRAVPVLGGAVRTVADDACSGAGFSPDGSQIAYVSNRGATTLTLAQADGTRSRSLHTLAAGEGYTSQCWFNLKSATHAPAWSPDGRWIALSEAGTTGDAHLQLVSAANGQARDLGPPLDSNNTDFNWLSDGSGLVFTGFMPGGGRPQAWEISYPGGVLTQLTNDLQGYTSASLSSQGALVLVHGAPQTSVWVQAQSGGEFQQLPGGGADREGANNGVAWTPQGGLITLRQFGGKFQIWVRDSLGAEAHAVPIAGMPQPAYTLQVGPNGIIVFGQAADVTRIWRVNGDGSGLTELVQLPAGADAYNPAIVPAGRDVLYMLVANGKQSLWSVPAVGGSPHQVWDGSIYAGAISLSPDATRALVATLSASGSPDLSVIRLDGGQPQATHLAFDRVHSNHDWSWAPDGRTIIYIQDQGNVGNLWALPLTGGPPHPVTHFTELGIAGYDYSADRRLAIARNSPNSDAVLAAGLKAPGH
ncbi:MAG TPA: protein kinase [Terriglobales bacterium]|nr:protein kinase [Terriglobales bacterium]